MSAATTCTASTVTWAFCGVSALGVVGYLILLISTLRDEGGSHNNSGSELSFFHYPSWYSVAKTSALARHRHPYVGVH